jgi:sialic acid synthase SpsE
MIKSFTINNYTNTLSKKIGINEPVFIIAEIGSTHCASVEIAKKLIDIASQAKVDCVKFQKRDIETLLTKSEKERKYDNVNAMAPTYGEHRKIMEFTEDNFKELQKYANSLNLFFTASGWDKKSIDFLNDINVPFIKVASADLTNLPLLEHIAKKNKPIFLSTGMGNLLDVIVACDIIKKYENRIVILQCTSSYPAPYSDINLNVLKDFKKRFPNYVLGYSGHELGILVPCAAVALGAKVIEKHFTLDKNAVGSDHKTALDPTELIDLVKNIRIIEKTLGSYNKTIQPSEQSCIEKLCKSVTTLVDIKKGEIISENMITTKSPGNGIPANNFNNIIGSISQKDIESDTTLQFSDLVILNKNIMEIKTETF